MKKSFLALVFAIGAPVIGSAQPYVAGQLGYANAEFPVGAPYNGVIDDSVPMLGINVGLGFAEKWAAEFGFNTYDSLDGMATPCAPGAVCTPLTTEITGNDQNVFKAALVRRFNVGNFRFFGKAGYYRANVKTNINLPGADDFTADGALLGIGMRWYFDSPWNLSLEAERFDDNVSQVSVGFGWGFGGFDDDRDRPVDEPEPGA